MAMGLSDGTHYEDDINYYMGKPDGHYDEKSDTWTSTEDLKKQQNLSQPRVANTKNATGGQGISDKDVEDLRWTVGIPMHLDQSFQSENIEDRRDEPSMGWLEKAGRYMWQAIKDKHAAGLGRKFYPPPEDNDKLGKDIGGNDIPFYFVRHGETPENEPDKDGNLTIREKHSELTDKGRQQAEQAADKLKEEGVTDIFSSSLPRARESAEIIGNKLGIVPKFDDRLNTWGMGTLEGQPCSEENLQMIRDHMSQTPDKPLGGEESFNDFKDRTFAGIRDSILNGTPGKTAILTHSKVEDAFDRWKKTGQDNPSLDVESPMKEEKPGSVEPQTLEANSTIMQPATYSKKQFAGGPGPTPQSDTPFSRYMQYAGKNTMQSLKDMLDPYNFMPSPGNLETAPLLGMFGGVKGSIGNYWRLLKRDAADSMEQMGHTAEQIFKDTGWYRDVDNHWKFVIRNSPNSKLITSKLEEVPSLNKDDESRYKVPRSANETKFDFDENHNYIRKTTNPLYLEDIYNHPELYEAYPEARKIEIHPPMGLYSGAYYQKTSMQPHRIAMFMAKSDEFKSTLQHEIQHYIQNIEGFPSGGNPSMFEPSNMKDIRELLSLHESIHKANFISSGLKPGESMSDIIPKKHDWDTELMRQDFLERAYNQAKILYDYSTPEEIATKLKESPEYSSPTSLKAYEILREHPELQEKFKWLGDRTKDLREIEEETHARYRAFMGEVEARNAQWWANVTPEKLREMERQSAEFGEFKMVTPRDTAEVDVPEADRIRAEDYHGLSVSASVPNLKPGEPEWLKDELGIKEQRKSSPVTWTPERIEALKKHIAGGGTLTGKKGFEGGTNRNLARDSRLYGIDSPGVYKGGRPKTISQEEINKVKELRKQGKTFTEIAEEANISKHRAKNVSRYYMNRQ